MKRHTSKEKPQHGNNQTEFIQIEELKRFAEARAMLSPYWAARAGQPERKHDKAA